MNQVLCWWNEGGSRQYCSQEFALPLQVQTDSPCGKGSQPLLYLLVRSGSDNSPEQVLSVLLLAVQFLEF